MRVAPLRLPHEPPVGPLEPSAVEHPGQRVGVGEFFEPGFGLGETVHRSLQLAFVVRLAQLEKQSDGQTGEHAQQRGLRLDGNVGQNRCDSAVQEPGQECHQGQERYEANHRYLRSTPH